MESRTRASRIGGFPSRRAWLGLLWGLCLVLAVSGCPGKERGPGPQSPAATVNGETLSRVAFLERLGEALARAKDPQRMSAPDREALKAEVLTAMIEERLIVQRARILGLAVESAELAARIDEIRKDYSAEGFKALFGKGGIDYAKWQDSLRQRLLIEKVVAADVNAGIVVDEAEAEKHYLANRKAYASEERLQVQQIVVHEAEQAEAILKRLKAGDDFGKVAKEVSIGPEGTRGGDLGFVERGVMPEAIDKVIFSLSVGKLSRVVESPYGHHIFKVLAREEKGGRTFAEARLRVIAELRKVKEAEAYERWIAGLRTKATIEILQPLPDPSVPQQAPSAVGSGKNE